MWQADGVEIVYGYACGDLSEAAKRKEVYLGGCCIGVDDPNRHCLHCRHEWHELEVRRRGMI